MSYYTAQDREQWRAEILHAKQSMTREQFAVWLDGRMNSAAVETTVNPPGLAQRMRDAADTLTEASILYDYSHPNDALLSAHALRREADHVQAEEGS